MITANANGRCRLQRAWEYNREIGILAFRFNSCFLGYISVLFFFVFCLAFVFLFSLSVLLCLFVCTLVFLSSTFSLCFSIYLSICLYPSLPPSLFVSSPLPHSLYGGGGLGEGGERDRYQKN